MPHWGRTLLSPCKSRAKIPCPYTRWTKSEQTSSRWRKKRTGCWRDCLAGRGCDDGSFGESFCVVVGAHSCQNGARCACPEGRCEDGQDRTVGDGHSKAHVQAGTGPCSSLAHP